jgi:hypothetical protein
MKNNYPVNDEISGPEKKEYFNMRRSLKEVVNN